MQENLELVEWLDGPTRRAAIEKLSDMTNLIGYSTLSKHFPYKLRGDAPLADNIRVIMEHQYNEYIGRVGGSVNRNEWVTTGSSVDAMYYVMMNQIILPAGILQLPFFAVKHHPARNFGSIIGHELTHGFDNSGRYYADDGNLRNW